MSPGTHPDRIPRSARWLIVLVAAFAAAIAPLRADGDRPVIEGLQIGDEDGTIRVSFEVAGVFTEETMERIHAGTRLSFEHRVSLLGHRIAPLFPRVMLARTVVTTTVRYDSLTRRYEVERSVVGKSWPKDAEPPDRVEQRSTSSPEEMESWMTAIENVPLPRPNDERDNPVKIKVRTDLGIRFLLMFLPWPNAVTAEDWLEL